MKIIIALILSAAITTPILAAEKKILQKINRERGDYQKERNAFGQTVEVRSRG